MNDLPINQVVCGDNLVEMRKFPANSIHGIVTDPPYGWGFMEKEWDKFCNIKCSGAVGKKCGIPRIRITKGKSIKWSNCGCGAGWKPGIMLDPFCGSGQALIMAKKLGRDYIGIDIVPEYCDMTTRGLENVKVSISA